ncbi:MAG: hypothetical protein JXR76_17325, partial [Deltaproteobacteria bacterium]|nr:hypothetical protein [Deltaproteobacteria bacterium]
MNRTKGFWFYSLVICFLVIGCVDSPSGSSSDADTDADTDTDTDSDGDSDSDSDADSDSDTDADGDTDTDSDSDGDSDSDTNIVTDDTESDTEIAAGDCKYDCSAHCYSIGGQEMEGYCETTGYKCCLFEELEATDSAITEDSDTGSIQDSETDNTDTESENDGCIADGSFTYTLQRAPNPSAQQEEMYQKITEAMDEAIRFYNCYTDLSKTITVEYNSKDVPTADGNVNGNIRFGQPGYMIV